MGGWAHACSLYSGVNSRAPHTKPLDEDIKQGFHSPRSFSLSFSHCFRWLAPGRSWAGASLDLLVNRIRATQVSSEGNSALAQSPQTVQHVQSLVVRHRTKAQYEVGGPGLTRRSKNQWNVPTWECYFERSLQFKRRKHAATRQSTQWSQERCSRLIKHKMPAKCLKWAKRPNPQCGKLIEKKKKNQTMIVSIQT